MERNTIARHVLGLCALGALGGLYACTATGNVDIETEIEAPGVHAKIGFHKGSDGTTFDADATREHANDCVEVRWLDDAGNVVQTITMELDHLGRASGMVPPGATRWEFDLVDCPHGAGSGGGMWEPLATGSLSQSGRDGVRERAASEIALHIVLGGPILPSETDPAGNLTYCFLVRAMSFEQASSLVRPIVAGGIGTEVPGNVEVIAFATMIQDEFGARLVQAQPGLFLDWDFEVNDGAFRADLEDAANYQVNGWDVVEVNVPLSAFQFGTEPGVLYQNAGTSRYHTDRLSAPVVASYDLQYSL